jgi:bifunctional DNA-binding transcriptional regulator/antitoxin component of YhaV-PrlF toxin-antitoxin module
VKHEQADKTEEATMKAKLSQTRAITIPQEICEALKLETGAELSFRVTLEGEIILSPEVLIRQYEHPSLEYPEADDLIWRGTTDEYMAWLRDGGPDFFDPRRPGEKTFSETVAENVAAFVKMRDAMRDKA